MTNDNNDDEIQGASRDQILAAARRVAVDLGLDQVTFTNVADAAERSRTNVVHHMGSAEDLTRAVAISLVESGIDWDVESGIDWDVTQTWVRNQLPDDHDAHRRSPIEPQWPNRLTIARIEAVAWLARHGVEATE